MLRSLSKLDSVPRNVKHFSAWFDELNSKNERSPWLYIYQDTIFYDGKFGVGSIIIDPHFEFARVRYGLWKNYYLNGKLYSIGKYALGATIFCTPGGPLIEGYSYKVDYWEYMYESGEKMASGIFKVKKIPYGQCKGDYELVSVTNKKWKFHPLPASKNSDSVRLIIEKVSW